MKQRKAITKRLLTGLIALALIVAAVPTVGTINVQAESGVVQISGKSAVNAIVPTTGLYIESVGIGSPDDIQNYWNSLYNVQSSDEWYTKIKSSWSGTSQLFYVTVDTTNASSSACWGIEFKDSSNNTAVFASAGDVAPTGQANTTKHCTIFAPTSYITDDRFKDSDTKISSITGDFTLTPFASTTTLSELETINDCKVDTGAFKVKISGSDGSYSVAASEITSVSTDSIMIADYSVGDTGLTVSSKLTIPSGMTLTVPSDKKLTIDGSGTLEIANGGTLKVEGSVENNGTIENNGTVNGADKITNNGTATLNYIVKDNSDFKTAVEATAVNKITLSSDAENKKVTLSETSTLIERKLTLDLNGDTLDVGSTTFKVHKAGELTVTGTGTVTGSGKNATIFLSHSGGSSATQASLSIGSGVMVANTNSEADGTSSKGIGSAIHVSYDTAETAGTNMSTLTIADGATITGKVHQITFNGDKKGETWTPAELSSDASSTDIASWVQKVCKFTDSRSGGTATYAYLNYGVETEAMASYDWTKNSTPTPTPSGGGGGGSVTPTPDPDPEPEPEPEPTPTPDAPQDPDDYTDPDTGDVVPDMVEVPTEDATGAEIEKQEDGTVTVTDSELGTATQMSPAVFAEGAVYRLYNPNTGEHFYTKNPEERNALSAAGWNYEADQTTRTIAATEDGALPVYRVYNPNSGLHHYTMNKAEALMLKDIGWNYEGISLYAYDNDDSQGAPMYRLYNPNDGQHHYTASQAEYNYLAGIGWNQEGPAWRVKN